MYIDKKYVFDILYYMEEIIIAFDVDGTLISNSEGVGVERLNIDVYHLMVLLSKMKNTKIIVWSGGGKDYAEQIVKKYGLSKYVTACYSKQHYDETINGIVDIAIDDQHEFGMANKNLIVRAK